MMTPMNSTDAPKPRTPRHFEVGATVYHREHGQGVIRVNGFGERYPYFEGTKTTGTTMTRVYAEDPR